VAIKRIVTGGLAALALLLGGASGARADYVVLRNGARLDVTGYEILSDRYRLHVKGGVVEVPLEDIVGIEPQEVFEPIEEPLSEKTPFQKIIHAAAKRYGMDADLITAWWRWNRISIQRRFRSRTPGD